MQTRQVVLDTETTGLEASAGHRVIEIGAVEIANRRLTGRHFHHYLRPDRRVEQAAFEVHGISDEFLLDKPAFAELADEFIDFIQGAELVIHNAAFDVGFLDHELQLLGRPERLAQLCQVSDSLALARHRHPGQRNSLDALCKRYGIDNGRRELHGALLDAEILAEVYLAMTGGQVVLSLDTASAAAGAGAARRVAADRPALAVVAASVEEREAHRRYLAMLAKAAGGAAAWPEQH